MILDATCGLREMWFQKDDPDTIYLDRRKGAISSKWRQYGGNKIIRVTVQADNRYLPFRNETFSLVVYDPPHHVRDADGTYQDLYGKLSGKTWIKDIWTASRELFRVLKIGGFLILKWSESSKKVRRVVALFPSPPLFGTKSKSHTYWIVFRKGIISSGE